MRFRVFAAVALLAAQVAAAPVPKGADQRPFYFPTEVGAKWVYETADGEVESVAAVKKGDDGALTISREGVDGTRTGYADMLVSAGGLRQGRGGLGKAEYVLKADVKSGTSWEWSDGTRTVTGPEEVQVPVGKFTALRVVWEESGVTYTSWYAPGVGEVKRVRKFDGTETVTRALKSFQPKGGK